MKTSNKKKMVLSFMCVFLVFTFVHPWAMIDNIVTPDSTTVSRPIWVPHPIYRDIPPDHFKEVLWVWTGLQALVILVVGGGAFVFVSNRGETSKDARETLD